MYRIHHKPTGLFYKPASFRSPINVSKDGKVYARKPTLKFLGDKVRLGIDTYYPVVLDDWEIIEYCLLSKTSWEYARAVLKDANAH